MLIYFSGKKEEIGMKSPHYVAKDRVPSLLHCCKLLAMRFCFFCDIAIVGAY